MNDWKIGESKELLKTPIWTVSETEKTMPNGKVGKFISLNAPDWVSAIIVNGDTGKFLMNHEFRHGVNKVIMEFPCGTVEAGETAEEACLREVKEETGYTDVRIVTKLDSGNPNPAFMNNLMTCFLAVVHGKPSKQKLDDTEFISTVESSNPIGEFSSTSPVIAKWAWYAYNALINKRKFYINPDFNKKSSDGLYHEYYVAEVSKAIVTSHMEKFVESENAWQKCGDYAVEDPGIFIPQSKFVPANIWECSLSDWMLV